MRDHAAMGLRSFLQITRIAAENTEVLSDFFCGDLRDLREKSVMVMSMEIADRHRGCLLGA